MIASAGDLFVDSLPAQAIELYEWQAEAVEALRRNIRRGVKNQILAAPTGAGKTVIASHLIDECRKKGNAAVFVCDRIPLIDQTSATLDRFGIPHGVIQADHWRWQPWQKIQVASAQTLARRAWPENLSLIVVDEAHTIHRSVAKRIAERDCTVIGLTATPFTRGLGRLYEDAVTVRTTRQLMRDGYLCEYDIWSASVPDMTGAKVVAGEWTEEEAEKRAMPIIGDIVSEYLKHGYPRKFIAFGVNVKHCEEIQKQMMAAGVHCGLYTYQTTDGERAEMIREFARPESVMHGLVSVAALSKGFDNPAVEVVIMARPLRSSLAEHIQILGRGLRHDPANPEKRCIVLDHAGNCQRFWHPMTDFFDNGAPPLDMGVKKEKKKPEAREKEPFKCPQCSHVHDPRPMCPMCFAAGTLVLTEHGWQPIEEVQVGTLVLTHRGRWRPVVDTLQRTAPVIEMKGLGHPCLVTTADHPFLTRSGWEPAESAPEWATPAFIERFPVPAAPYQLTPSLCRLIGCYLGDGFTSIRKRALQPKQEEALFIITCGHTDDEVERVRETVADAGFKYTVRRVRTGHIVTVYDAAFTRWLRAHFGKYAHGKYLPSWIYGLPSDARAALLRGYIEADGYDHVTGEWHASSVSKALAFGIKLLAQSIGYGCRLYVERGGEAVIEGRHCQTKDKWRLIGKLLQPSRGKQIVADGGHYFAPIKARRAREAPEPVFDLTVDEDHSYVVEGIVVHNCGHEYPRRSHVEHVPGELSALTGMPCGSGEDRQSFYSQLIEYGIRHDWKPKAADYKYRDRFGEMPVGLERVPAPPTLATEKWIKSTLIAWSKSRKKAGAR